METKETVEKKPVREPRTGKRRRRYRFEEKLKAVRLHLQEGFEQELVSQETGVSSSSLSAGCARTGSKGKPACRGRRRPVRGAVCPRRSPRKSSS